MIYIEALDVAVHFIDLRFNLPNFKAYEQLELLFLEALASNDFVDEIEYLKLFHMMMEVSSGYCEKGVLQQSSERDPRKLFPLAGPPDPQVTLAA